MKKILSLQGGGCLGKGQAVALAALEAQAGKPIAQVFDLVGGTSVGAILGACIASGAAAQELNDFFDLSAPKIFRSGRLMFFRLFGSAKYSAAPLEAALKEKLGAKTLNDCECPFLATAVDMASGRNVYFQSYGQSSESDTEIIITGDGKFGTWELWEVARASSAAQTYFPAYQRDGLVLWDGGSTGNNAPDMLLLTEARELGWMDLRMLSLGNGKTVWPFKGSSLVNPSLTAALSATIHVAYAGPENSAVWQAASLMDENHVRLNPSLGADFAIDDAGINTLLQIASAWKAGINAQTFERFLS